jgi:hypothetical protein
MFDVFFAQANLPAILLAAVAYFILGSLWYSLLFGEVWTKALESQGIIVKEPTRRELMVKLLLTFLANLLASSGMAYLIYWTGSYRLITGIALGIASGICFGATGIGVAYVWESRPVKLFLVDTGYHLVGLTVAGMILSVWK